MISPKVWHFKSPPHTFSAHTDSSENKQTRGEISNHFFNHSVTLIFPDAVSLPEDLSTALTKDNTYYKVDQLPVRRFLDKRFIDHFVKSGKLSALSLGTHIDTDDCAAVTPSGHLVLNLLKETYQSLGLEGTQSKFSSGRFVVQIELKNSNFTPGKKNYERVVKCLTEFVDFQMDFLIAWDPPEVTGDSRLICPSSIAAYLSRLGYTVTACSPRTQNSCQNGVQLPSLDTTPHQEMLEWLGAMAIGVDTSREDAESKYLSTYTGPLENTSETQVEVLKYFGFFTALQIERFFNLFRAYIETRKDLLWGALYIQGFADSPVSWGLTEHTFHSNGDNFYTILLRPDHSLHLLKGSAFSTKMKLRK